MLQYYYQLNIVLKEYSFVNDFMTQWLRYGTCSRKKKVGEKTEREAKEEELMDLYNLIMKAKKVFDDDINRWQRTLYRRLEVVVRKGDYQELLIKIKKLAKTYSFIFSQTMRHVKEGEDIYGNLDPFKNLFVLEHKICALMKVFREFLDKKVVFKVYALSKEVDSIITTFRQFLNDKIFKFNEIAGELFDKWPKGSNEALLKSKLSGSYKPINFFKICSPLYRKYMKKKLGLSIKARVRNEDLVDFFEYFGIKYALESPLIVSFVKCWIYSPTNEHIQTLLCLDVSFAVNLDVRQHHAVLQQTRRPGGEDQYFLGGLVHPQQPSFLENGPRVAYSESELLAEP